MVMYNLRQWDACLNFIFNVIKSSYIPTLQRNMFFFFPSKRQPQILLSVGIIHCADLLSTKKENKMLKIFPIDLLHWNVEGNKEQKHTFDRVIHQWAAAHRLQRALKSAFLKSKLYKQHERRGRALKQQIQLGPRMPHSHLIAPSIKSNPLSSHNK